MNNSKDTDWQEWIDNYVVVKDSMLGKLKYFGNTEFGEGMWCGIELVKPLGKNDGMVNNVRYFACKPMFGLFVPSFKVVKVKNSNLAEKMIECEHSNKTFIFNDAIHDLSVNYAIDTVPEVQNKDNKLDSCKLDCLKFCKSGSDSEESLGILNTDLMNDLEISWDSPKLDSILPLNNPILKEENPILKKENSNSNLLFSKDKLSDEFCYPMYASTPRHSNTKQILNSKFEYPLHLREETAEIDVFEEQCQHTQELFFDIDKLKNTPHLSSTSKNLVDLDSNNMVENSLFSKVFEKSTKQDKGLNKNLSLQNSCLASCQNLDVTYELSEHFSPVIQNITVANILSTNNSFINTAGSEEVDCYQSCSKLNELNATFELKKSDNELKVGAANPKNVLQMNKTVNLSEANFSIGPWSITDIGYESVLKQTFVVDSNLTESCHISLSKDDLSEGCNDHQIENDSCVKKSKHSTESKTSSNILLEYSSEKSNFPPWKNCCNTIASTKNLLDSNITMASKFQKLNKIPLNDTFVSLKSEKNDSKTNSNVENNIKSNQSFKKPFSTISKFKQAYQFHKSRNIKKVKEEKSSTIDNFIFNKKETKLLKSSLNTNFSENKNLKNIKRNSLASSSSLDSNFTNRNSIYSRRLSLSSDTALKTNIDKQETLKLTKRVSLVSSSVATLKKNENTVKLSETKLKVSSNFDNGSSLSKLGGNKSSLKVPTKLNKNNQAFQSSQICQRAMALNIKQSKPKLNEFNSEKSEGSRLGTKLRCSLRIPKFSNDKNEIQRSQICQGTEVSDANSDFFVPSGNYLNTTSSIINKPEIELEKSTKTNFDLLNETLIAAEAFPSTSSALKKSISSFEKIEKDYSNGSSQKSLPITCKNINGSKEMSIGIHKLKACSTNIPSGIKIPRIKSNYSSACPSIGIIKPRFSMMHQLKNVNAKKLESENMQPSQNLLTSKPTSKFGFAAKPTSKLMNFAKKPVFPLENNADNELLKSDHSTMKK